jgi:hypothetical protein
LDVWIEPDGENITRLIRTLDAFGFASLGINENDFLVPGAMVQLGYPPSRIDLLTTIDGVTFEECYTGRIEVDVLGVMLPVIAVDHLIRNKLAAGRAKDLADVALLKPPSGDK